MEDRLQQIRERGFLVYESLSPGRRLTLIALGATIIATLIGLVYISSQTEFETLYSGVDDRFGGKVIQELKSRKIEFETAPGGAAGGRRGGPKGQEGSGRGNDPGPT